MEEIDACSESSSLIGPTSPDPHLFFPRTTLDQIKVFLSESFDRFIEISPQVLIPTINFYIVGHMND